MLKLIKMLQFKFLGVRIDKVQICYILEITCTQEVEVTRSHNHKLQVSTL